ELWRPIARRRLELRLRRVAHEDEDEGRSEEGGDPGVDEPPHRPEEHPAERDQDDLRAWDEETRDEDGNEDEWTERLPGVHQRAHRFDGEAAPQGEPPPDGDPGHEPRRPP